MFKHFQKIELYVSSPPLSPKKALCENAYSPWSMAHSFIRNVYMHEILTRISHSQAYKYLKESAI